MAGSRMRIRVVLIALLAVATVSVSMSPSPAAALARPAPARAQDRQAPAGWIARIDRLVRGLPVGVSIREEGNVLYAHREARRTAPASNEKLLLSMAILDVLGAEATLMTRAAGPPPVAGVVAGDLWILGEGDPSVGAKRMRELARAIRDAGVARVDGSVFGSTGYFKRDWRARGWKRDFPRTQVALPTALTFEGNSASGTHIRDPELRAARALTQALEEGGVRVTGPPGAGVPPAALTTIAEVPSAPLPELLEYTNRFSSNFYAEVLGKRLGAQRGGAPGSIRKGAAAIEGYAREHGVALDAYDASGLSYSNRVAPAGIVRLLDAAEDAPWGEALREALPGPGQGTLQGRLRHIDVHAKTGTLTNVSALSGWVYLRDRAVWAEFSILSRLSKDRAVRIEDRIVRLIWRASA